MKSNILFLKNSGSDFTKKQKDIIFNAVKKSADEAAAQLNLDGFVNFTVYPSELDIIKSFAEAKNWASLFIPNGKRFNALEKGRLERTIFHELHHLTRGHCIFPCPNDDTLLGCIFSEGLAIAFEVQQVPGLLLEYPECTEELLKKWLPEVGKKKWRNDFNYNEWFYGTKRKLYHLGYTIGYYLVGEIFSRHPELTPVKLAKTSAEKLLQLSGVNV